MNVTILLPFHDVVDERKQTHVEHVYNNGTALGNSGKEERETE